MICPSCGTDNHPQAASCYKCAAALTPQPRDQYGAYYQQYQQPPSRRSNTALIVLAVVAVGVVAVAGLALMVAATVARTSPTLARARDKARQTTCLHNTRMLQTAVLLYCEDWAETYPLPDRWCDQVSRFVPSPDLYTCPSADPSGRCDYGMNSAFRLPSGAALRIADIADPAQTVMLFESHGGWNNKGGATDVEARHNDGANFGYTDGHAKWVARSRISTLAWDPRRPGR